MITERVNRNATHFRIFTNQIILRDKRLDFIAHRLVDCHLSRDRGAASSFGTTASLEQRTPIPTGNTTHLGGTFSLGKRPAQLSFEGSYC
jgi:hypothetical protein